MNYNLTNTLKLVSFGLIILYFNCKNKEEINVKDNLTTSIECTETECKGQYVGEEFIDGSDVAHQFSNQMSALVGNQLKALYMETRYSAVDFDGINMSTEGMGSGEVVYQLVIPFKRVDKKCDAYTSFDHVGGWNHTPALEKRKQELNTLLLKGHTLEISDLKTIPEGLQEYWIQWKQKELQQECE